MKELSIEEKAKRYDEIIKLVNSKWVHKNQSYVTDISEIFPELKESEDENIRKDLIDWVESYVNNTWRDHNKTDIIAWLKKRNEKKETNNQILNILWHNVNEEPEVKREIFCEWKSSTGIWHSIVFYHPYSKTFYDREQIIKNVLRWTYVDEMLKKQNK